jgi:5-methylthioadenosine/S-adenosylhomocysteine deaminase
MDIFAISLDETDVELMARTGCAVAHCPESNMKLASGVAPVPAMLKTGLLIGLGTDGCASNNDLDMLGEMDTAAKLHKVHTLDPTAMDASTVVRMATIDGARTLGLDHLIGSLEQGKQADLIVLDFNQPHLTPCFHLLSHLVYAARGNDVRHVMINGCWAVKDRCLTTIDLEDVLSEAQKIKLTISAGFEEETQDD